MFKQVSLAAAVGLACLSSGVSAQALQPSGFAGAAIQIHLSGATAPQGTILNRIQNDACGGAYTRLTNNSAGGTGSGLLQVAIGCTTANGTLAFYYTTTGSNFGVQPIIQSASLPRVDVAAAGCNTNFAPLNAVNTRQCTATVGSIPNLGVSDIPPSAFVNVGPDGITVNNVPTAAEITTDFPFMSGFAAANTAMAQEVSQTQLNSITVRPIQGVIFGLVASHALATQLGAAGVGTTTGTAATPNGGSIPRSIARAIFGTAGWDKATVSSLLGFASEPTVFKVCKRVPTSGTQALANVYFRQEGFQPRRGSTAGTIVDGFTVIENPTSGNIRTCMDAATAAGEVAIGIISRETGNLPTGTTAGRRYAFLGLDGIAPDTAGINKLNVIRGGYDYVGEATFQYRNNSLNTAQQSFVDDLVTTLTSSTVCADAGAATMADEDGSATTTCESRASRKGDHFKPSEIRE
jgi:hypothetical protein